MALLLGVGLLLVLSILLLLLLLLHLLESVLLRLLDLALPASLLGVWLLHVYIDSRSRVQIDLLTGMTRAAKVFPRTTLLSYMMFWGATLLKMAVNSETSRHPW